MKVLDAMRRYAYGFVNSHDFEVCRELMSDDYVLHMGADVIAGRDEAYIPAVSHQFAQFPTLGFAIHDLVTDGEWAALLFSEHGTSVRSGSPSASWLGVSIYRYADGRLRECWVEQDHYSRRMQLRSGVCHPVPPVAVDPWAAAAISPNPGTEDAVRSWLREVTQWPPPGMELDPGPHGAEQPRLDVRHRKLDVLVVSGDRAAFHITVGGPYRGGLDGQLGDGREMEIHVGGFARVVDGVVLELLGVTDRVAVHRRLQESADV